MEHIKIDTATELDSMYNYRIVIDERSGITEEQLKALAKEHDCELMSICYDYIDNKVQKLRKKLKRKVCLNRKKVKQEINALGLIRYTLSQYVFEHKEHFEALF